MTQNTSSGIDHMYRSHVSYLLTVSANLSIATSYGVFRMNTFLSFIHTEFNCNLSYEGIFMR